MNRKICTLSYANHSDTMKWGKDFRDETILSPHWHSAWLAETFPRRQRDNVAYVGYRRNAHFENNLTRKLFKSEWAESIKCFFLFPDAPCEAPRLPYFELNSLPPSCSLPFPNASLDIIYCDHAMSFLSQEKQNQLLTEIKRVLHPLGRLALTSFHLLNAPSPLAADPFFLSPIHPVNIKDLLDHIDAPYPYNSGLFPGFEHFNEDLILRNPDLAPNEFKYIKRVPDHLKGISYISMGALIESLPLPTK